MTTAAESKRMRGSNTSRDELSLSGQEPRLFDGRFLDFFKNFLKKENTVGPFARNLVVGFHPKAHSKLVPTSGKSFPSYWL